MASATSAIKIPKIASYAKNVGKSIAFASINALKEEMPGLKGFAEDNHDVFVSVYATVKDMKGSMRKAEKSIKDSNLYKAIEYGAKNMMEDARTGNFYNDRTDEIAESALGLDDASLGMDDFDYEVSSGTSSSSGSSAKYMFDNFNAAIRESTIGTTSAVARGTDMVIRSNRASTTILVGQLERTTATLHSGLGAVYNSINAVNTFLNGPMLAHMNNSKAYYEASLKIMQDQHAMMKDLLEMQKAIYAPKKNGRSTSKLDQSMNFDGSINLKGYAKTIKGNIQNLMDLSGFGMMGSGSGINTPMLLAAAPFKMLMDMIMSSDGFMPKTKRNLKNFDTAFSGLFGQFIGRINKSKKSGMNFGLAEIITSILGIDISSKTEIDTSKYQKGAVPFDGITRKTIIEVIPGYLARIEAALTGAGERHFNAQSGKWVSARQMESDWRKERISAIERANSGIGRDIDASSYSNKKGMKASTRKMQERIFEDGFFDPRIIEMGKTNSKGRATRKSSGDAYKYYGFKTKEEFDAVLSLMTSETFYGLAARNMKAKQDYSRKVQQFEDDGGFFNNLFNNAYGPNEKGKPSSPSKYKHGGSGLLAMSYDKEGHNVFYYLKEILKGVNARNNRKGKKNSGRHSNNGIPYTGSAREYSTASESEDDSGSEEDDSYEWDASEADRIKDEEERAATDARKKAAKKWVNEAIAKTPVGRFFVKALNGAGSILSMPMKYASDLMEKANDNIFKLMFGDAKLQVDGKPVNNVIEYIAETIKKSFEDIRKDMADKMKQVFDPIWAMFKKKVVEPYVKPVWNEVKNMGRAAGRRVVQGLDNTFGRAGRTIMDNLPSNIADKLRRGNVVSASEVEQEADPDGYESAVDIFESQYGADVSAHGRRVTRRGLTMISPGEIIIPASYNKKAQRRMLAAEKRDRARIYNAIGLNAQGTVNPEVEQMKSYLRAIYNENRGDNKLAKVGAGGVVGGGLGLLALGNPLLGAMAGAGIAVLNNSETMQKVIFGNESGEGGLVPKKIQDTFKKYLPDMTDYGIAGGVLGLFSPFGVLGGAAIGAGIGMLKNNEGFKRFVFGDETTGEDGLISRESYDKAINFIKKAAPKAALGAGIGILTGPFGLLGNAAIGAGAGLLSQTELFHDVVFGNKEEGTGGIVGAFKTGFLDPAKDKFLEFVNDFKRYAKENIINPMKDFWKPMTQAVKNVIKGIGDGIADKINDSFEKWIGLPLHDWMQEKLFRPMSKMITGVVKLPYTLAKGAVSLPFRAMGGIGNSVRAGQIRRGTAYDMTASERLAWRDQHKVRFNWANPFNIDHMYQQDEMLSAMDADQLRTISSSARAGLKSYAQLQRDTGKSKMAVGNAVSNFFNANDPNGRNMLNRVGYKNVKKLAEIAQTKGFAEAVKYIDKMPLSDDEKTQLKQSIEGTVRANESANFMMSQGRKTSAELDAELSKALGYKVKGRAARRKIMRSAEAELKDRMKPANVAQQTPEEQATNRLAKIYEEKSQRMIDALITMKDHLERLAYPDKKDTRPPGDKAAADKRERHGSASSHTSSIASNEQVNQDAADRIDDAVKKKEQSDKKKSSLNIFDQLTGRYISSDPDAKESVENVKERARLKKEEAENTEANKKTNNILMEIKEGWFGKKGKYEKEGGIFSKLWDGAKKFGKFIGIGGLVLGGASLFGYATEWFRTDIWPTMKTSLFGTKDSDGNTVQEGLVGKIGHGIKTAMLGEDGYGGLLGGMRSLLFGKDGDPGLVNSIGVKLSEFWENKVKPTFKKVKEWYEGEGGLTGMFLKAVPTMLGGLKLLFDNVGAPLFAAIFKALPPMIGSLAKALLQGMKIAIFDRDAAKRNDFSSIEIDDGGIMKKFSETKDTGSDLINSQYIDKATLVSTLKTPTVKLDDVGSTSIDFASIFKDKNSEQASGVAGLLGRTQRTNKVEFDENGNVITDYKVDNTSDSVLSRVWDASINALDRGLSGQWKSGKIFGKMAEGATDQAGKAIANMATPGVLNKAKGVGNAVNAVAKTATGTAGVFGKFGDWINKGIKHLGFDTSTATEVASDIVEKGTKEAGEKVLEEVGEEVVEKGIKSGFKGMFKQLAEGGFAKTLASILAKATSKSTTEALVKKVTDALIKLADKISSSLLKNVAKGALNSVGNLLSKFTPAAIISLVYDFWKGYDNAHTILGITKNSSYNVTFGHKCVCGIVNMLTEYFTLGFLPPETIIDIVVEIIFPLFGLDAKALEEARVESTAKLDEWNKAHIDDPSQQFDNFEDFNNKDKWTTKAWNTVKGWFDWGNKDTTSSSSSSTTTSSSTSARGRETLVGRGRRKLFGRGSVASIASKEYSKQRKDAKNILDQWNATHPADSVYEQYTSTSGILYDVMSSLRKGYDNYVESNYRTNNTLNKGISKVISLVTSGNQSAMTTNLNLSSSGDDLSNNTAGTIMDITKMVTNPVGTLVYSIKEISSGLKEAINKRTAATNTKRNDDNKVTNALNGSIDALKSSTYWSNTSQSKNGILGTMNEMQTYIEKIMAAPISIVKTVATRIRNSFTSMKSWFGTRYTTIVDWVQSFFSNNGSGRSSTSTSSTRTNTAKGRFGLAHNYQSGALANVPYGDSTIGEAGCAPVAAANLLGSSVMDAANYAESRGMTVPGGGTDMSFFNSYLGSKGIPTRNTSSRSSVMNALANGNQVIMLGQDNYDAGAPFGTTPHFITAKGISSRGNIIAEDPDLPYSSVEYSPDQVMDSMVSSVIAGLGRRRRRGKGRNRMRRLYGKGSAELNALEEFISKGVITSQYYEDRGNGKIHGALDIVVYNNAPVPSFTNGTVKDVYKNCAPDSGYYGSTAGGGFGNFVTIVDDANYYHTYGHLNKVNVNKGDKVNRGDIIGLQGHTGSSTGSHLHYQIAYGSVSGAKQNPHTYLKAYNQTSADSGSNSGNNSNGNSSSSSSGSLAKSVSGLMSAFGSLGKSLVKALFGTKAYTALFGDDSSSSSSSSSGSSDDYGSSDGDSGSNDSGSSGGIENPGTSLTPNTNTSYIFSKLRSYGFTDEGAAGIMGNLSAESAYRFNNLQDSYESKLGYTDDSYTKAVNNGTYSRNKFINDSAGYGIAQWTHSSRKQKMYDAIRGAGDDIHSSYSQMKFLNSELTSGWPSLSNYLKSSTDVNTSAERVLREYESPANPDAQVATRQRFAWSAYNAYAGKYDDNGKLINGPLANHFGGSRNHSYYAGRAAKALNDTRKRQQRVGMARNVGYGAVDYATFLTTIVEILISISDNTAMLNKLIAVMSEKFDINISSTEVSEATKNTSRAQAERHLRDLVNSSTNTAEYSKILNNKDTAYLLSAMQSIATE